jgi:hypothetical protein
MAMVAAATQMNFRFGRVMKATAPSVGLQTAAQAKADDTNAAVTNGAHCPVVIAQRAGKDMRSGSRCQPSRVNANARLPIPSATNTTLATPIGIHAIAAPAIAAGMGYMNQLSKCMTPGRTAVYGSPPASTARPATQR